MQGASLRVRTSEFSNLLNLNNSLENQFFILSDFLYVLRFCLIWKESHTLIHTLNYRIEVGYQDDNFLTVQMVSKVKIGDKSFNCGTKAQKEYGAFRCLKRRYLLQVLKELPVQDWFSEQGMPPRCRCRYFANPSAKQGLIRLPSHKKRP